MSKEFYVTVTETLSKTVRVQAKDRNEAYSKVQKAYEEAEVVLTPDDFVSHEIFEDTPYHEDMIKKLPFLREDYQVVK